MPYPGEDILASHVAPTEWVDWAAEGVSYSGITVGNGSVTASYMQTSSLAVCRYRLVFGSTTSFSGTPQVTLPVTASGSYALEDGVGTGHIYDTSVGSSSREGIVCVYNSNRVFFVRCSALTGTINATTPFTWTTGDILTFTAVYEASV